MGKKSEGLLKRMREARGYLYPEWEFGARLDPELRALAQVERERRSPAPRAVHR